MEGKDADTRDTAAPATKRTRPSGPWTIDGSLCACHDSDSNCSPNLTGRSRSYTNADGQVRRAAQDRAHCDTNAPAGPSCYLFLESTAR